MTTLPVVLYTRSTSCTNLFDVVAIVQSYLVGNEMQYYIAELCTTLTSEHAAHLLKLIAVNFFAEFAENGSIYDYIFKEHKQPPPSQILLWATQVAEGMVVAIKFTSSL